jgi:hypothetical protein
LPPYRPQARTLAERHGIVAVAPEDVGDDDPAYQIVNRLRSIWPKTLSLTPETARVFVHAPAGVQWFKAMPDHLIFFEDGDELGPLLQVIRAYVDANIATIYEQIGLADIAEDTTSPFTLQAGPPWTAQVEGEERSLCARWEDDDVQDFHRIHHLVVTGTAVITVQEVSLTHARLGDVMYAYGQATIEGKEALLVFTENDDAGKATIRLKPPDA